MSILQSLFLPLIGDVTNVNSTVFVLTPYWRCNKCQFYSLCFDPLLEMQQMSILQSLVWPLIGDATNVNSTVFVFTPYWRCNKCQFYSLWFDLTSSNPRSTFLQANMLIIRDGYYQFYSPHIRQIHFCSTSLSKTTSIKVQSFPMSIR